MDAGVKCLARGHDTECVGTVRVQSTVIFAAPTTGPQISRLSWIILRISSGVLPSGAASSLRIFACMSGSLKPLAIASEIFWVIAFGVPGGADTAIQIVELTPGSVSPPA